MADTEKTPNPSAQKTGWPWTRVVLIVSLGLNIAILGAIAGSHFSGKGKSQQVRDGRQQMGLSVGPYGRALSQGDRRAIGRAFMGRAEDVRGSRREMRALGAQVVEALRAEEFDADRVATLLQKQVEIGSRLQNAGQELLIERISAMSASERAVFADNLERMLKRGKPRKPKP